MRFDLLTEAKAACPPSYIETWVRYIQPAFDAAVDDLAAVQRALREREAEVADLKHLLDARQMVVERFQMMRDELAIQVDEKNTTIREQAERIARLEKVYLAAFGLCFGEDWNKGNHAIKHGYRQRLRNAVAAIEERDARQALSPAAEAGGET